MVCPLATMALAASLLATGGLLDGHHHRHGGRITPPGPGYGWGFPNGNPDGYGWVDYGTTLPIGADRTPDYFFRRQFTIPAPQLFLPNYYNPYVSRGQRYLPYAGCGGAHPAGGPPTGPSELPYSPYEDNVRAARPAVEPPTFTGNVGAPPEPAGGSGLIP